MPSSAAPSPHPAIDLLLSHRSIRRFTDAPVPDDHIRLAVQAGQAASTSSAHQAYTLLQVTDPDVRSRLAELAGGQSMVAAAGAFFVVCGDSRRHRLLTSRAGGEYDAKLEGFLVAAVDAALFAQNVAVAFEAQGYGICYVGGLRNQLDDVDALLGLPHGVYPLFGLCVGRPAQDPMPRPRLPVDAVWVKDRYPDDADLLATIDGYDEIYRAYMQRRSNLDRGWSPGIAKGYGAARRVYLGGYYRSKGAVLD